LAAAAICVAVALPCVAADYNQAARDYSSGNYAKALGEFSELKGLYPNNALVRYYLALCEQAVGHFEQAKSEFGWVAQYGDARLKGMAQSGLQQLSGAHTSVTSGSGSTR